MARKYTCTRLLRVLGRSRRGAVGLSFALLGPLR
jgi:Flp pilus assembly protein TadG